MWFVEVDTQTLRLRAIHNNRIIKVRLDVLCPCIDSQCIYSLIQNRAISQRVAKAASHLEETDHG